MLDCKRSIPLRRAYTFSDDIVSSNKVECTATTYPSATTYPLNLSTEL